MTGSSLRAWLLVVVLGLVSLLSGFLGAVSQFAQDRPQAGGLNLVAGLGLADLPTWPWFVLTPALMTVTFLAIERAHDRKPPDRGEGGREGADQPSLKP